MVSITGGVRHLLTDTYDECTVAGQWRSFTDRLWWKKRKGTGKIGWDIAALTTTMTN